MRQKPQTRQTAADKTIKDIRRATRKQGITGITVEATLVTSGNLIAA